MKTEIKLDLYNNHYLIVSTTDDSVVLEAVSPYEYLDAELTLTEAKTLMYELTKAIVMMESKQVDKRN